MADNKNSQDETIEVVESVEAEQNETESLAGDSDVHLALEDARAKADEHWNQLLRAKAEMENVRRRAEKDLSNAHKFALEKFVTELLPVVDSLELGMSAAQDDSITIDKIREGSELTLKMLTGALEKFNVAPIDPMGEKFNPEFHQAMSMQENADMEPNTVMAVFQKGFTLNDRVVRPAMVVVSKAVSTPPDTKIDEMA